TSSAIACRTVVRDVASCSASSRSVGRAVPGSPASTSPRSCSFTSQYFGTRSGQGHGDAVILTADELVAPGVDGPGWPQVDGDRIVAVCQRGDIADTERLQC